MLSYFEQALFVDKLRNLPTFLGCIEGEIPVYSQDKIIAEVEQLNLITQENFRNIVPEVFCKLSRRQPFFDGNKRATYFLGNNAWLKTDLGLFYLDYAELCWFNYYLKDYYQGKNSKIFYFIGQKFIRNFSQLKCRS